MIVVKDGFEVLKISDIGSNSHPKKDLCAVGYMYVTKKLPPAKCVMEACWLMCGTQI